MSRKKERVKAIGKCVCLCVLILLFLLLTSMFCTELEQQMKADDENDDIFGSTMTPLIYLTLYGPFFLSGFVFLTALSVVFYAVLRGRARCCFAFAIGITVTLMIGYLLQNILLHFFDVSFSVFGSIYRNFGYLWLLAALSAVLCIVGWCFYCKDCRRKQKR